MDRGRALVLAAALLAGACGGSGQEGSGAAAPAPVGTEGASSQPGTLPGEPSGTASPSDPAAAQAAADARWTAGDTSVPDAAGSTVLLEVRTARHDDFDRIVYEFEDRLPGYRISYIDRPVRQCGSGFEVPFDGDAWLSMTFEIAAAHTEAGMPTVSERTRRPGLPNILDLKLICDFEGQVEWVAGVRSPTQYRVLTLHDPARIVIDVRHP